MRTAPVSQNLEGFLAVEIVSVDDGEGLVDDIGRHEDGVGGAPGLHPFLRDGERSGNLVQFLGDENKLEGLSVNGFYAGVFFLDGLFHLGFEGFTDNIDHFAEPGLHGVVDAVVDNGFSMRSQTVHLLEAAITAAHACCQYK